MDISPQDLAILLLTVFFGTNNPKTVKPLSTGEWVRFLDWLEEHEIEPSSLLEGDVHSRLSGLRDKTITGERIRSLLDREAALEIALKKWQRAGLWAMTKSDSDYPIRLKRRLGIESPAVLFGSGDKSLLNKDSVAVIGSRDANDEDFAFTFNFGKKIVSRGYSIVSGGARGVDQRAIVSALYYGGSAIGVIAYALLKAAMSAQYRKKIRSGNLVLISSFNPEAGFNVGNAMTRNRYIYCLADAAVVISSTADKGGTWSGAIEGLKAKWVPVWVKKSSNPKSGNSVLASKGAYWLPDDNSFNVKKLTAAPFKTSPPVQTPPLKGPDLFELFVLKMQEITAEEALKKGEISKRLELTPPQVKAWLQRGVAEEKIEELTKPVRYQATDNDKQVSLFKADLETL